MPPATTIAQGRIRPGSASVTAAPIRSTSAGGKLLIAVTVVVEALWSEK